jgi:protein gp37
VLNQKELDAWVRLKEPSKIFIEDMADLFHEEMPLEYLDRVFLTMVQANWHIYQILTKRPEMMLRYAGLVRRFPDHVWAGTSVESWPFVKRIDILRQVPVKVRFVSFEPLIDSVIPPNTKHNPPLDLSGISWAIAGGESGPNFRPLNLQWTREIRDQCQQQGVAFFFKQVGGLRPKSGGRILDGRTWGQYPGMLEGLKKHEQ